MSLRSIIANFTCDVCGGYFEINMDPAVEPGGKNSLFDSARHFLKYEMWTDHIDGLDICTSCCKKLIQNTTPEQDNEELTATQIKELIG